MFPWRAGRFHILKYSHPPNHPIRNHCILIPQIIIPSLPNPQFLQRPQPLPFLEPFQKPRVRTVPRLKRRPCIMEDCRGIIRLLRQLVIIPCTKIKRHIPQIPNLRKPIIPDIPYEGSRQKSLVPPINLMVILPQNTL